MDKEKMMEKLQNVANTLEGVTVVGHENRKRLVIAVEVLMQLAKEIREEKTEVETDGDTAKVE